MLFNQEKGKKEEEKKKCHDWDSNVNSRPRVWSDKSMPGNSSKKDHASRQIAESPHGIG